VLFLKGRCFFWGTANINRFVVNIKKNLWLNSDVYITVLFECDLTDNIIIYR